MGGGRGARGPDPASISQSMGFALAKLCRTHTCMGFTLAKVIEKQ